MRYSRQLFVIGETGQRKIENATVAVAGLGGLGCNVITHLASAGVENFIVIDDQSIEESNLNRQFIYTEKDIGKSKPERMAWWIKRLNPEATVKELEFTISDDTASRIGECDLIMDCLDNYDARMALNKYAYNKNIKMVHGGAEALVGQVTVIIPNVTPCLQCIFPKRKPDETPSISPMVGTIGSIQAMEAIKILSVRHSPLVGKLLTIDQSDNMYRMTDIGKDNNCGCCSGKI
jgi:adenylyltransferase/sulfurtransferase